jgi:hypothetical protein
MGNSPLCPAGIQGDKESLFNVLAFCDRETRAAAIFVSKRYSAIFTTDASFRWRLDRLHIEHGIYFPTTLGKEQTWKSLFLELDKKRHLWEANDVVASDSSGGVSSCDGDKFRISVYARFKPLTGNNKPPQSGRKAVLPLHQRLALIRIDKSLNSNSDALAVLKQQGGWFKNKWDEIEQNPEREEHITATDQPSDLLTSGIKHINTKASRVVVVDSNKGLREFEFDGILTDDTSQKNVYASLMHGLVCDVINGVSATAIVFGQKGSGKTYTMFGAQEDQAGSSFAGIVPRACSDIMSAVQFRKDALNLNIECYVCVSKTGLIVFEMQDLP